MFGAYWEAQQVLDSYLGFESIGNGASIHTLQDVLI